jgi:large conductance mechanosensitive channel
VADVLMPPIGMLLGDVDFTNLFFVLKEGAEAAAPYTTLAEAQAAGAVTVNYGVFVNSIINFLIVAFAIFLLIRNLNKMKKKEEAAPSPPRPRTAPIACPRSRSRRRSAPVALSVIGWARI